MGAFFALLLKEFTLRRKSCCAIFVNLILPLLIIFIQVAFRILIDKRLFLDCSMESKKGYSLAQNDNDRPDCYEGSFSFHAKYYASWLEMRTWYDSEDSNSGCSFGSKGCTLGIAWNKVTFNVTKATDVDELTEMTRNKALNELCRGYQSTKSGECNTAIEADMGLHINYIDEENILNLTYYIGHDLNSRSDQRITDNLQLFHFTAMARAYLSLTGKADDPQQMNKSNANGRSFVFLNFTKERAVNTEERRDPEEKSQNDFSAVNLMTMLSLIVPVRHILYEKRSKLKDLMHMSGVGNFKYYASYFLIDVVILLVFNFLQLFLNTCATLEYYVITAAYTVAATLFTIAFTVFFTREAFGLLLFSLVLVLDFVVSNQYIQRYLEEIPDFVRLLLAIYPVWGLKNGFQQLDNRKKRDHLQLFKIDHDNNPTFLQPQFILFTMIVSWVFYNFVIFYIGEVWPWQSGTARSLLFPLAKLKPSFKSKKLDPDRNAGSPEFEPEPNDLKVGIEVNNVKKRYGFTKLVLKGVFLKVFHGQISVLLGHNGAGKTTLMSIITGLDSATSGKVLINGVDVDYEPTKARRGIGMCPQINSQYDKLSVWQHLKFFGMLKGYQRSMLSQEIYRVLNLVKLTDAHNRNSKALSGGMKRRLQLGMAFIGGSRILILDEPSSGLDVEARRVVWDMLLAVKREYLIFMTTHHMEEADCLGDRVIIMHDGEIRCIGSTMFLKRVFGVGLTLRVSKGDNFQSKACSDFIQQYLKSATLTKETRTEVLYLFSKTEERNLPQFFKDLDPIRSQLGVSSCGVAITTMDDVFVRVGEKYDAKKGGAQGSSLLTVDNAQKPLKPTFCLAFYGLLVKRFHVTKRSKMFYLIVGFSLLVSILLGLFFLKSTYQSVDGYNASFELDEKYGYLCIPNDSVICNTMFNDSSTDKSKESAFTIEILNDFKEGQPSCLRLTPHKGQALGAITETFRRLINEKMNSKVRIQAQIDVTKRITEEWPRYIITPILIMFWSMALVIIPFRAVLAEKRTNVKLLQLMTGISPFTYWFAHFVFDYLLALVFSSPLLVILLVFYFSGGDLIFNEISSAALFYLGFLYLIFSCLIWSYMVSTIPLGPAAGIQLLIYYCLVGYIVFQPLVQWFMMTTHDLKFPAKIIYYGLVPIYLLIRISPLSQFEEILVSAFDFSDKSAFCKHLFKAFKRDEICDGESWTKLSNLCCNGLDSFEPWKNLLIAKNWLSKIFTKLYQRMLNSNTYQESFVVPLLIALITLALFILLILGLEYLRIARRKWTSQARHSVGEEDLDVYNERMATEKVLAENGQINKALVVKDLTKKYGKKFVVNRLTVTIEKDQIFGFLGVNGAGKSTAFKMMVGEINRTGGEAYIGQYSLSKDFQKYRAQIGYCPQFDTFVTGLTGKEMLYLFARLRGCSSIKKTVNQMINLVDLQDYAKYVADNYSGGNKRKLSAAMALIGFPKVIFLDEPTAAVDPVARRKIWKVMEHAKQASGSSIVLTSHALDECEALCEKIVVMVAGQLKCLGSLQHLKEKFGQGLHITAKTKPGFENLPQVQEAIMRMVPSARVVDSHTNITILHVTDPQVKIGDVYGAMEQIRAQFDLEDYQVEETNLEQIFLYFAKAAYK